MIHNEDCKNGVRAERADRALELFANITGISEEDIEIKMIDLLSDLIHLCDRDKIYFEHLLSCARMHYEAEKEHNEETCEPENFF